MDAPYSNTYTQKERFFLDQMKLNVDLDELQTDLIIENKKIADISIEMLKLQGTGAEVVIQHHEITPSLKVNTSTLSKMMTTVKGIFDAENPQNVTFKPDEIMDICKKRAQEIQERITQGHIPLSLQKHRIKNQNTSSSLSSNVPPAIPSNAATLRPRFTKPELQTFVVKNNALTDYPNRIRGPITFNADFICYLHHTIFDLYDLKNAAGGDTKTIELIDKITAASTYEEKKMNHLIDKIKKNNPELNDPKYQHGLEIAAYHLIHKTEPEVHFDAATFGEIFGTTITQINKLEALFLKGIDWELDLTKNTDQ